MIGAVQVGKFIASEGDFRYASATHQGRALSVILCGFSAVVIAMLGYLLHVPLSAAEPLELLLVFLVALRVGFLQASVTSVVAVLCLDYLFIPPLFGFTVADPQNWISLFTFEAIALFVSRLSSKVRSHATTAEEQKKRAVTLYEMSRAILHMHLQQPTAEQLTLLIREFLAADQVAFWTTMDDSSAQSVLPLSGPARAAHEAYLNQRNVDDVANRCSSRVLQLGMTTIGGMTLDGWLPDPLMADAVASLSALAFERARATRQESRAEIARDAEQLRTAVLDGLAHGFKTPLTAIQTASSGLLALGNLNPTQTELLSMIDDRATMLGQLTTQLLQTAALDAKQLRLHRKSISVRDLAYRVLREQEPGMRSRVFVSASPILVNDHVDGPLVELALQQLLDNAVKYSAVDTPIQIHFLQNDQETTIVIENAANTAHPIHAGETTKVFQRFYRGNRDEYGPAGTGLGLSIVKKIAESHGGHAWVECGDQTVRFLFSVARLIGVSHE